MVVQANSTLQAIRQKVRRLTASSSESVLSTDDIDQYVQTYYNQDFPYSVKLDQMRSVYTLFTSPYVDRYPLDVNQNQGIRGPMYVQGVQGAFYKDREQFYNVFPRWPTLFQPISGDGTTTHFTFNIGGGTPILPTMITIGGVDANGTIIRVVDDGGIKAVDGNFTTTGNLILVVTDSQGDATPPLPSTSPIPTSAPITNNIGTVNYVTGDFSIDFPVAPAAGSSISLWASQYTTGRPYALLFWNNEFQIRPIPNDVYKIEIETYLTPKQFADALDTPTLHQWWQLIAIGAAMKVLEDRQDMEGLANLIPLFDRQEALALERQGVEEIGQKNVTMFSGGAQIPGWNQGVGWWY